MHFPGFFKDKKYTVIVRKIIRINKILGNVAGWMPLFNIGGTSSNVKVVKKANIENIKITKQALNSVVKKRDEFNFAPYFFLRASSIDSARYNYLMYPKAFN